MFFDWLSRIDELAFCLSREYGIEDRGAIEILLAALIDCPRTPACWLILETNWYSRECSQAWFSFGGTWIPYSLGELRARRPRQANDLISDWLNEPSVARLLIEPDWDQLHSLKRISRMASLFARCLRLRMIAPRSMRALAVDEREQQRRSDALHERARQVLEDRAGLRPSDPPAFRPPRNFLYHAEILQRLAPWYPDWNQLLNALASLAVRHAYLYGRSETGEEDWRAVARAAADSVPPWIAKALRYLAEHPAAPEESAATAPGSLVQ